MRSGLLEGGAAPQKGGEIVEVEVVWDCANLKGLSCRVVVAAAVVLWLL